VGGRAKAINSLSNLGRPDRRLPREMAHHQLLAAPRRLRSRLRPLLPRLQIRRPQVPDAMIIISRLWSAQSQRQPVGFTPAWYKICSNYVPVGTKLSLSCSATLLIMKRLVSPMGLVPTIGSHLKGCGGLRGPKKQARFSGRADTRVESGTFGMSEPVYSADGT